MKKIAVIISLILIIFIGYNFSPLTPKGAIRIKMFFSGYPKEAITTKIIFVENIEGKEIYRVLSPPYEVQTGTMLNRWIVEQYVFFYCANYGVG